MGYWKYNKKKKMQPIKLVFVSSAIASNNKLPSLAEKHVSVQRYFATLANLIEDN